MSDHAWVQENVAAYLAGGLDPQEVERLEAHAVDCPACSSMLAEARQFDSGLLTLFAGVHPAPGLEDRAIAQLRAKPTRPWLIWNRRTKWVAAAVLVLAIGGLGAVVGSLESKAGLKMEAPGELTNRARRIAPADREELTITSEKPGDEPGLDGQIEASLPEIDRTDKQKVDAAVTADPIMSWNGVGTFAPPGLTAKDLRDRADALRGHGIARAMYGRDTPPTSPPPFDPAKFRPASSDAGPPSQPKPDPKSEPSQQLPGESKPQPGKPNPKGPADPANPEPNPAPQRQIIIRSGEMEFEVPSFDAATATITKLVLSIKGGFIATVNSDKLPNGKVRGAITVRVPPEQLDGLVLDLRRELGKGGELKGVKLTSQDVTKTYTDLESRLRGARTMEQRLLQVIKEGKGEIKQLLEAERELGVWRTKIEEFEGELRYYSNLAAFSTLTITLTEKDIRAAAAITERERVQAGVEVEDVDKAYQQVLAAVVEAKGRITKSELKQLSAGQFNATFHFEVAPDSAGPIRDRLRMLGRVARLEIDRTVQTEGGTLPSDAKTTRGDTVFLVQLYNLANVAPRETATLRVAVTDVPNAYQSIRDAIAKAAGRVLVAQLNEQDRQNVTAVLEFEVRRSEEGAVRAALDAAGEVLSRQVTRAAESDSVTDTKVLYKVGLLAANRLKPREVVTLTVELADVDGSATLFAAQVAEAKGRQVDAKFDRDASGRSTAKLVFEVPLSAAAGLVDRFKAAGTVRTAQSVRDPLASDGRYAMAQILVTLTNAESIVPEDGGLWSRVRQGLSVSVSVLLTSVTWLVFGLCVVLPWALIGLGGYRIARRFVQPVPAAPAAPAVPAAPAPAPASSAEVTPPGSA